jgi:hypothetical protein
MKKHELFYELTTVLVELGEPVPTDWLATLAAEGYDLSLILNPEKETIDGEDEDTSR